MINFLLETFREFKSRTAIVWHDQEYKYGWLVEEVQKFRDLLNTRGVNRGSVVAVQSDFSPTSTALMLALIELRCIYVPISDAALPKLEDFLEISEAEWLVTLNGDAVPAFEKFERNASHNIYQSLHEEGAPGLVLFSSGSTGKSKGAVHDFGGLLEKFKIRKQQKTLLAFLLFDHIGGLNTLLYSLSNGGTLVTTSERSPEKIAEIIDRYSVQILPTSPTFCNLMLLRDIRASYSLKSLEVITYGTEVMPENTLKRLCTTFPWVKLQQTYGLSEIGIMRSKSQSNDSLWVKIGGEGFQTRVVDGLLEVKAVSAMKGYLNAPNPFTEDGWFKTGDAVEVQGEYFRILGRKSEIINVGGEKVYPSEVESALLEVTGVEDCIVFGEKHPLMGSIVAAKVNLSGQETPPEFRIRMRQALEPVLEKFKIPQKIMIEKDPLFGGRFKRTRGGAV